MAGTGKPAAKKKATTKAKAPAKAKEPAAAKAPAKKKTGTRKVQGSRQVLMDNQKVAKAIGDIALAIHKEFRTPSRLLLLGIRTRGVFLAERLQEVLEGLYEKEVPLGVLDITFYRDDLSTLGPNPMVRGSELPFDIHNAKVILVDDVLYTGRTIRAAMDEISDFGRPALIRLATLVDRGLREYPIQPDYCGLRIDTKPNQRVTVLLDEVDDVDDQVLIETYE